MSTLGETTSGGLHVVQAGSLDELAAAGVATKRIAYVDMGEWALATPEPPLATTGAGPCLVVIVHHRSAQRGGLAHVSTSHDRSQKDLFESATATIVGLLEKCVAGGKYDAMRDPPLDVFLGAGDEFFPGNVLSKARVALPKDHEDLPAYVGDKLSFNFDVNILDRRQRSAPPPPPSGERLYDPGYVVYDAASAQVFLLDRRNGDLIMGVQKNKARADEKAKGKTWGKHP
jgi:hypothetical protein